MNRLRKTIDYWEEAEYPVDVVPAPQDAVTFDKMLVVFLDETRRSIRRVSLYDSKTDRFVADF